MVSSQKKNDLPYIEVSVVKTQGDKLEILQILKEKASISNNVDISMKKTPENPILRIVYLSEEELLNVYKRDEYVYESAVKLVNLGVITPSKIKTVLKNGSNHDEDLYLILKYKTNFKAPILKNYSFTYKLAEMLGLSMSYEEVDDGFLLFYQTREDFEVGKIDLTQFKEVKRQLEERDAWQNDYEKLWDH